MGALCYCQSALNTRLPTESTKSGSGLFPFCPLLSGSVRGGLPLKVPKLEGKRLLQEGQREEEEGVGQGL